jgi:hypothetical protein
MAEYMDLVVIRCARANRTILGRAPWLTHFKTGATVKLENGLGGEVLATYDTREDNDELLTFLKSLADMKEDAQIPKVVQEMIIKDIKYEDDEDDRED